MIKSTGAVANVSAKHVDALSNSLLKKTGIDDEVIQSGENMLLTFRNIRNEAGKSNDIFDQATRVGLDMSTAMKGAGFEGGSLKTTMIRLGKALNDPVQGMTALKRVGVTFSDAQKKTITQLEKTGHHLMAQKLILRELRAEFGGSAAAYGKTLPGKLMIFKETLRNVGAYVVGKFIPVLTGGMKIIEKFGGFIARIAHAKNIKIGLDIAGAGIKDFGSRIKTSIQNAIASVNWKPIGMQLGKALGSGIVFSADTLNTLLGSMLSWVNAHGTQIADIGATLAVKMVLTLTDPVFWSHHVDLLIGVLLLAFGDGIGRVGTKIGGVLVKALGPTFERGAGELALFFMKGVAKLPGILGDAVAVLTSLAARAFGVLAREIARPIEEGAGRLSRFLVRAFRLGAVITVFRLAISGLKDIVSSGFDWIVEKALRFASKVVGAMASAFGWVPGLGGKLKSARNAINNQLDQIELDKVARKSLNAAKQFERLARGIGSVPSDTTVRFIVKTLTMPDMTINGRNRGFAGGGFVPGTRTMADSVPAMLSPGEFVVTGGGERMLESMTFPGVLNWLQGRQPRHFAGGGRASVTKNIEYDRLYQPPAGGVNMHGLVPQVTRAVSFARGHGWHGSVTSGFRTYAQQAALYQRYLAGGPLAARPGTSSHERGQAVDVSDYGMFGLTMAGAPSGSRLYNRLGSRDPVHFSVTGFGGGGRVKKPKHQAPRLPATIREAEAKAAGTPGLADDITAYSRELHWVEGQLQRSDLTPSERTSMRVRKIRVTNRLASLRKRQKSQRRRSNTDITLPASIREAQAKARLTGTLNDDITAKGREVAWYQSELAKHPGRERRIALTNALADALEEYKSLLSEREHAGDDDGDSGSGQDNSADLQAQLDQSRAREAASSESARLANAFVATGVFGSDTGGGGGGMHFHFHSDLPPTEEQARMIGEQAARGAGGQPYRSTSVVRTGY